MLTGEIAALRRVVEIENGLRDMEALGARLQVLEREYAVLVDKRPALETERIALLARLQGTATTKPAQVSESKPGKASKGQSTTATAKLGRPPRLPAPGTLGARILKALPATGMSLRALTEKLGARRNGISVCLLNLRERGLVSHGEARGEWRKVAHV